MCLFDVSLLAPVLSATMIRCYDGRKGTTLSQAISIYETDGTMFPFYFFMSFFYFYVQTMEKTNVTLFSTLSRSSKTTVTENFRRQKAPHEILLGVGARPDFMELHGSSGGVRSGQPQAGNVSTKLAGYHSSVRKYYYLSISGHIIFLA